MKIVHLREEPSSHALLLLMAMLTGGLVAGAMSVLGFLQNPGLHPGGASIGLSALVVVTSGVALALQMAAGEHDWRAAMRATLAFCVSLMVLCCGAAIWSGHELAAADGPATELQGTLSEIHLRDSRRSNSIAVRLAGHPDEFRWSCRTFCRPWRMARRAEGLMAGTPVRLTVIGANLIGFEVRGVTILQPTAERRRLLTFHLGATVLSVLFVLGLALRIALCAKDLRQGF